MKKIKLFKKSKKGATLVELIVAIALISIVFASAMTGMVHGYVSVQSNKTVEDASMQAQGVADIIVTEINELAKENSGTNLSKAIADAMGELEVTNNFTYSGGINSDGTEAAPSQFPDPNSDVQVLIESTSSELVDVDGVKSTYSGYKVTVAAPCVSGNQDAAFVTVDATAIVAKE